MSEIVMMCRPPTPFTASGALDESALRWHLNRLAESRIGFYLCSGGVGEAYTMTLDEIRRVYEIAVEECRGKVRVYGGPPEQHTAKNAIIHAKLAAEAGCDACNIYPIAGWHGYKPRDRELLNYYETVLTEVKTPVTISAIAVVGYMPSPQLMADLVHRFPQVVGINIHAGDHYLVELKDRIKRDIDYYTHLTGSLNEFAMGATALLAQPGTIIPKSFRAYMDHYEKGNTAALGEVNAGILRFSTLVERWAQSQARWTKMCMKVLKMPGGEGGLRPPNLMPADDQLKLLSDGLRKVGLPEVDELLRTAGLA